MQNHPTYSTRARRGQFHLFYLCSLLLTAIAPLSAAENIIISEFAASNSNGLPAILILKWSQQ